MLRRSTMALRLLLTLITLSAIVVITGCNGSGGSSSNGGFSIGVYQVDANGVPNGYATASIQGNMEPGTCGSGCSGSVTSLNVQSSQLYPVPYGEVPANWDGQYTAWCGSGFDGSPFYWGPDYEVLNGVDDLGPCVPESTTGNGFFLSGSLPTSLTIPITGGAFSSTYGMPQISVFSVKNLLVSQGTATSVGSNGSSATFSFPKNSGGTALAAGEYGFVVANKDSSGEYHGIGGNFLSIGSTNTYTSSPLGVAAIGFTVTDDCTPVGIYCQGYPTTTSNRVIPMLTLSSGQLSYDGATLSVGSQPTAVQAYSYQGFEGQRCDPRLNNCLNEIIQSLPTHAVVANSGSNSVTVVNINNSPLYPNTFRAGLSAAATITVGTQPVALLVTYVGGVQTAYVANLGSGTVSQINLSTNTVTGTVNVGSDPTSLALDPSGAAFWVGGLNYISKVNTSNLSIATTYPVSGQVTSLSISAGQNAYVYTVLSGTTFSGEHAALSTGVAHTDYQIHVPARYLMNTPSGLPTWLQIGGPLVSAAYSNRYIVEGTPTGFIILDLQTDTQMLQGATTAAITGIAVDDLQGTVYALESSTDTLLSIPLPPVQTN